MMGLVVVKDNELQKMPLQDFFCEKYEKASCIKAFAQFFCALNCINNIISQLNTHKLNSCVAEMT